MATSSRSGRSRRSRGNGATVATSHPPRSRPLLLLALATAALLGFLVSRYSAVPALLQVGPQTAARLWANHPAVRVRNLEEEVRLDPGSGLAALSYDALVRAPLSEIPALAAARAAQAAGNLDRSARLVAIAARRNPRSRQALLLKLDQDLRGGDDGAVAAGLAVLTRLYSDASPLLVAQLASMAEDPTTRAAVQRVMASDPEIREQVLERLASRGAEPQTILDLAGPYSARAPDGGPARWQRLLVDGLVRRGHVDDAFRIWRHFVGADAAAEHGLINDPEFRRRDRFPPFDWILVSGGEGFAEPARAEAGLAVEYYGRADLSLARQLLRLPAGRYSVRFQVEGRAEGEGGGLAWTVACHPGERRLVLVAIRGVDFNPVRFSEEFVVPETGCRAQWLSLVGNAAEFPEDQQVTITGLTISRPGDGR